MKEMIRKAQLHDVREIHALVNGFAERGEMLALSLSELYDNVRDFAVAMVHDAGSERIVGCCALRVVWEDLAEIRSLAVAEDSQRRGLGRALVNMCLEEARALGVPRIFALTYLPEFFSPMGFKQVDRDEMPHKVWVDCLRCPKFPECDEVPVAVDL